MIESRVVEDGVEIRYVQAQLGPAMIGQTVDTNGHLVPSAHDAAMDKLDRFRQGLTCQGGARDVVSCAFTISTELVSSSDLPCLLYKAPAGRSNTTRHD